VEKKEKALSGARVSSSLNNDREVRDDALGREAARRSKSNCGDRKVRDLRVDQDEN
jgi:hypothetical protein